MKNVPSWFFGHERPANMVDLMPRSVEGGSGA
jgi:hypothetical protein